MKGPTKYLTRSEQTAERVGLVLILLYLFFAAIFWVIVAYVVIHFVTKYW